MTDTVFPSTDDTITETALRRAFKKTAGAQDYVITGFVVSIGTGVTVNITAGEAMVNGTFIKRDSDTNSFTVTASATRYIYAYYDDTTQNTMGFLDSASATPPSEAHVLLATYTSNGSAVTSVTDKRNLTAIGGWRDP